jgi:hypothetical protein
VTVESNAVGIDRAHLWLRRQGDNGTTWSNGGLMGSLGEDTAGGYRFGWYLNPMERYEFAFLGSFVWERNAVHAGPVTGWLTPSGSEPAWFDSFQGSQEHEQVRITAKLRTYELNKRWITDDLGNHFFGLQIIDYQEQYGLDVPGFGWRCGAGLGDHEPDGRLCIRASSCGDRSVNA